MDLAHSGPGAPYGRCTDDDQAVTPGQELGGDPRMVNARTYPLWRNLALSEDLPKEALKTVIEA
ncbi:hypothetical protein, partial [Streptomyces sp. NPDC056549]|uniref:hypothetical protein n=1 Tax=Streptomyces sp. NPDC056549 TaxID=3345864 RepID=UPI0036CF1BEB